VFGGNNGGELGLGATRSTDNIARPRLNPNLAPDTVGVVHLATGGMHCGALTHDIKILTWGFNDLRRSRKGYHLDCCATGLILDSLHSTDVIRDLNNKQRILTVPTPVPGLAHTAFAAAGSDHTIAISKDFKAFSWGFNVDYQTGQKAEDDVECATLIDHPAINGQKLVWAGAGGQFSILEEKP
jgi:regulator of chromosome condensation